MSTMPPDFVMYTLLGSALVGGALVSAGAVVVVGVYAVRRRLRRRSRDVYAERQGRRDGYTDDGLDVAAIRALLAHRDGKTRQEGER